MTEHRLEGVQEGIPRAYSLAIIGLLIAFVAFGVLIFYKWMVREPAISPEEANIKIMQQYVAQNPQDTQSVIALGYAYQKAGKLAQAREQYLKVIKKAPKNMACLYNLGIVAQIEKKYTEAEKYFKKVLAVDNKHYLANLGLAEVYLSSGKYDLAIEKANSLIKKQEQLVNPHLVKAKALEKKGKINEARNEFQKVLQFIPNQPQALEGLQRLK